MKKLVPLCLAIAVAACSNSSSDDPNAPMDTDSQYQLTWSCDEGCDAPFPAQAWTHAWWFAGSDQVHWTIGGYASETVHVTTTDDGCIEFADGIPQMGADSTDPALLCTNGSDLVGTVTYGAASWVVSGELLQ